MVPPDDDSLESQIPPEPGDDADPHRARVRRRLEKVLRDALKRGIEAGVGTINKTDDVLRGVVSDVKLPKEIVGFLFSQVDETKNALVRVVAKEIRDFLEATDIASEVKRALTSLSFEIKTEVRFIPNDAGGVKPVVRASSAPNVRKSDPAATPMTPSQEDDDDMV